jgi:hypothetical protein
MRRAFESSGEDSSLILPIGAEGPSGPHAIRGRAVQLDSLPYTNRITFCKYFIVRSFRAYYSNVRKL